MAKRFRDRAIAIDCETTGLDVRRGCKPYSVSMTDEEGQEYYWEWEVDPVTREPKIPNKDRAAIVAVLDGYGFFVFHNHRFDLRALRNIGIDLPTELDRFWDRMHDTLGMSHVLRSDEPHGLKPLALRYLDILDDDQDDLHKATIKARAIGKQRGWNLGEEVGYDYWMVKLVNPKSKLSETYNRRDTKRTILLYLLFCKALEEEKLRGHYDTEQKLFRLVYEMEDNGFPVNKKRLKDEIVTYNDLSESGKSYVDKTAKRFGMEGFNINSTKQLPVFLHDKLKLPVLYVTEKTGSPSTDMGTLTELCLLSPEKMEPHRVLERLIEYRQSNTVLKYLLAYDRFGLDHPADKRFVLINSSFNQFGTRTTRFSSNDPNEQNVSKREDRNIRGPFGPLDDEFWYDNDYENLELRLLAYDSGEEELIKAFMTGESVHMVIARELHPELALAGKLTKDSKEYKRTKNGNFAIVYGASPSRADATYGVQGAYALIRKRFKHLNAYMDSMIRQGKRDGYIVTLFGYRLYVPRDRAYAATNYRIQGTAGGVLKYGMLAVNEFLKKYEYLDRVKLICTVHDELIYSVKKELRNDKHLLRGICNAMASPGERIGIPTPVSPSRIDKMWSNGKELVVPA